MKKSILLIILLITIAALLILVAGMSSNNLKPSLGENLSPMEEITLIGTIKHFISDCAPSPEPTGCISHKFYLFENINGPSYSILNPNFMDINLKGKHFKVTGKLITPSKIDLAFIKGDLEVSNFSIINENITEITP